MFLGACSWDNSSSSKDSFLIQSGEVSGDFGSHPAGSSFVDKVFTFTKGETVSDSSVDLTSSDFSVVSATGCNRMLVAPSDKCLVKVRFLKNKIVGSYSSSLVIGSGEGSLTVNLIAQVLPSESQAPSLSIKDGASAVEGSLIFGSLKSKAYAEKILDITNLSATPSLLSPSVSGTGFLITSNNCVELKTGRSCQVKVRAIAPSLDPVADQVLSGSLSLGSSTINLSFTHLKAEAIVADFQVLESSVEVEDVDFGLILAGKTLSKVIGIKNNSLITLNPVISISGSNFQITSNGCSSLSKGKSCYIRVVAKPDSVATVSSKTGTLSISDKVLPLSLTQVISGSCASNQHQEESGCVDNVYISHFPSSSIAICGGEEVVNLLSCEEDWGSHNSADFSFCPPTKTYPSPEGQMLVTIPNGEKTVFCSEGSSVQNFVSISCDQYYQAQGEDCVALPSMMVSNFKAEFVTLNLAQAVGITGSGATTTGSGAGFTGTGLTNTSSAAAPSGTAQTPSGGPATTFAEVSGPIDISKEVLFTATLNEEIPDISAIFNSQSNENLSPGTSSMDGLLFQFSILKSSILSSVNWVVDFYSSMFTPSSVAPSKTEYLITQVADMRPGANDSFYSFTKFNGELYFVGTNSAGYAKLFRINSSGQVIQVTNTNPSGSDGILYITPFNGELYFPANNSGGYTKLFKVNTSGVVTQVTNFRGATGSDTVSDLTVVGTEMYFVALNTTGVGFQKVFKITAAGAISQVSNINAATSSDLPTSLTSYNSALYFSARNASGYTKVYKATATGVTLLSNINSTFESPGNFKVFNGELWFSALNSTSKIKLFRINPSGLLRVFSNTATATSSDYPDVLTLVGDSLYFRSYLSGEVSKKLFKISSLGILTQAADTNPGGGDWPDGLYVSANNELYFTSGTANGTALFKIDSSGTVIQLTDDTTFSAFSASNIRVIGDDVYFSAALTGSQYKLFVLNPSGEIKQLTNFRSTSDGITFMEELNNELYFRATDSTGFGKMFKIKKQ